VADSLESRPPATRWAFGLRSDSAGHRPCGLTASASAWSRHVIGRRGNQCGRNSMELSFNRLRQFPSRAVIHPSHQCGWAASATEWVIPQMAGAGVLAGYCWRKEELMPTPQREPLRRIVKGTSERVDQVRRATALLAVARGSVFIQAAQQAGLHSGTTVADLVGRFNRRGLAALRIASGRGRKPTYVPSARARIVATAQRPPDRRSHPTSKDRRMRAITSGAEV